MNLGFIILAHSQPVAIRRLTDILATDGNRVVVHFDSSASVADKRAVNEIAAMHPESIQVISKVHCVWGEWSLVEAVLLSLREFAKMPDPPDYIHLMSGADLPIRPITDLKEFLRRNPDLDFIESCDITRKAWVKGGLGMERLKFYFPFNFRTSRRAFDRMVRWQRKLKIRRRMPLELSPHMGSQWWTLRWSTCAALLDFIRTNPQVPKFFRTTWIPDESFIQTVLGRIIPRQEIADLQLMLHHLGPTGRPYVFYNDHLRVVRRLPHFFIRKVSPEASDLLALPGLPPRPGRLIPKPKHLAQVRDLLRARIDANFLFAGDVPGYLPPVIPGEPPLARVESRPIVLLLAPNWQMMAELEAVTRANPACFWLGRPFSPGSLEMAPDALDRIGMTTHSWRLRDNFIPEFFHRLVTSAPDGAIPVGALSIRDDSAFIESLAILHGLVPIVVSDPPLKPHQASLLVGKLNAACPGLGVRLVHVSPSGVAVILDDLANDTALCIMERGGKWRP